MDDNLKYSNQQVAEINGRGLIIDAHANEEFSKLKDEKSILQNIYKQVGDLLLMSMMYAHQSPLQALIGPGPNGLTDYILPHTCNIVIFSFIPFAFCIITIPRVKSYLVDDLNLCVFVTEKPLCKEVVKISFMNRLNFTIAIYFIFLSLALFWPFSKRDHIRPSLHAGFWAPKLLFICLVSLVTFTFPPGVFDRIWHHTSSFIAIFESILVTFLLLDFAKDISNRLRDKDLINKVIAWKVVEHGLPALLIILGFILFGYIFFIVVTERPVSNMNIFYIAFEGILLLGICTVLIIRRNNELFPNLQLAFIIVYVNVRVLIALSYSKPDGHLYHFSTFLLFDFLLKYFIMLYCLLRETKEWHYSYWNSIISKSSCRPVIWTKCENDYMKTDIKETHRYQERQKKQQHSHEQQQISELFEENQHEAKLIIKDSIQCNEYKNSEPPPTSRTNLTNPDKCNDKDYAYSFIYITLLIASIGMTINLNKWRSIEWSSNLLELSITFAGSLVLRIIPLLILGIYLWIIISPLLFDYHDSNSASELLTTFGKFVLNCISSFMIDKPSFVLNAANMRFVYTAMFFISFLISCIAVTDIGRQILSKSRHFCYRISTRGTCLSLDPSLVALSKFCISTTGLFLILCLLLLRTRNLSDPRNILQNGCWPLKIGLWSGIFATTFCLPSYVDVMWAYIALAATLLVVLLQAIFLVDITKLISGNLGSACQQEKTRIFYFSFSTVTLLLYATAITAFFCFYIFFAQASTCKTNRLFICINLVLCVTASIISLHPLVAHGGLLQSAIVTSFCMYCTWSGLYFNPQENCNPLAGDMFAMDIRPTNFTFFLLEVGLSTSTLIYCSICINRIQSFLDMFGLMFFKLNPSNYFKYDDFMSTINNAPAISFDRALLGNNRNYEKDINSMMTITYINKDNRDIEDRGDHEDQDHKNQAHEDQDHEDQDHEDQDHEDQDHEDQDHDDQDHEDQDHEDQYHEDQDHEDQDQENGDHEISDDHVPYNYSLFLLIHTLVTLQSFIALITWTDYTPGSRFKLNIHWAIMCIKMVASSCSVLMYIWSLVSPLLLYSIIKVDK